MGCFWVLKIMKRTSEKIGLHSSSHAGTPSGSHSFGADSTPVSWRTCSRVWFLQYCSNPIVHPSKPYCQWCIPDYCSCDTFWFHPSRSRIITFLRALSVWGCNCKLSCLANSFRDSPPSDPLVNRAILCPPEPSITSCISIEFLLFLPSVFGSSPMCGTFCQYFQFAQSAPSFLLNCVSLNAIRIISPSYGIVETRKWFSCEI